MTALEDEKHYGARLLDPSDPGDHRVLEELRADPRIEFVDRLDEQRETLRQLRPVPTADVVDERPRFAYYPWRRMVVGVLGPRAFRMLRLDRNRNVITVDEQERLGALTIGVVGLSVGHVIAHTLATEGLCGRLRLADFDELELSNLNRVPATVLDLGLNKAVVAARRIAEIDPYLDVEVFTGGLTVDCLEEFFDGLDVVVEECDSLEAKALAREAARDRGLPVVMVTSDRGLVDVERYDLEPGRPILHGLLDGMDSAGLAQLTSHERIRYTVRHADPTQSSARLTASLLEVGRTVSTWPQLVGEVTLGAAVIAEAVRRIGLGEPLASGQARVDVAAALGDLREPMTAAAQSRGESTDYDVVADEPTTIPGKIAAAANRAPSGGNAQPWHVETRSDSVVIRLVPERTSLMDVNFRGSAVAVGAALFNARVAAAADQVLGPVEVAQAGADTPLLATLRLGSGTDPRLADLHEPMLQRETNRHRGEPRPLPESTLDALRAAAESEGGRLTLLTEPTVLDDVAKIFAAGDRIRYLTPELHREMFAELRWPGDEPADTGIDVRSLELDPSDQAVLDLLRRPDVMAELARWDAGSALGEDAAARIRSTSALGIVSMRGDQLTDFARAGAAVEAAWIVAGQLGVAVQPLSPVFLHAVDAAELAAMSPPYGAELERLRVEFRRVAGIPADESLALVMRMTSPAPPPSVRSRRRSAFADDV
ncbi:MAG: hypothetical protein K0R01_1360 [Mycobacterium sp.]|nr:hypothetical protein [Mycobacterium sp.]